MHLSRKYSIRKGNSLYEHGFSRILSQPHDVRYYNVLFLSETSIKGPNVQKRKVADHSSFTSESSMLGHRKQSIANEVNMSFVTSYLEVQLFEWIKPTCKINPIRMLVFLFSL